MQFYCEYITGPLVVNISIIPLYPIWVAVIVQNSVKSATSPTAFKSRLSSALITEGFYSKEEFMAHNCET